MRVRASSAAACVLTTNIRRLRLQRFGLTGPPSLTSSRPLRPPVGGNAKWDEVVGRSRDEVGTKWDEVVFYALESGIWRDEVGTKSRSSERDEVGTRSGSRKGRIDFSRRALRGPLVGSA